MRKFDRYLKVIIVSMSIVAPLALLYFLDPVSFELTWKGRAFYLFFGWLFAMELILDWEKYGTEGMDDQNGKKRLLILGTLSSLPLVYATITSLWLNTVISEKSHALHIEFYSQMPLALEYLVFTVMFAAIFFVAYGRSGLKDFAISFSVIGIMGCLYLGDILYPWGAFTPMQMLVPPTTFLSARILSFMGYITTYSLGNPFGSTISDLPGITIAIPNANPPISWGANVGWPCSGIESLVLYTIIIALFLGKAFQSWRLRFAYFTVGAIITYFINILRIVTIFTIGINGGDWRTFHDSYGQLYSITWIVSYPLIIMGTRALWTRIRGIEPKLGKGREEMKAGRLPIPK